MTKKQRLELIARSRACWLVEGTVLDMLRGWLNGKGIISPRTHQEYAKIVRQFFKRVEEERGKGNGGYRLHDFLFEYRDRVEAGELTPSSYNVRLSAIKNVASMMLEYGKRLMKSKSVDLAAMVSWEEQWLMVRNLRSVRGKGRRLGRWLSKEEVEKLLGAVDRETMAGKRDLVLMALVFGAGLRRAEVGGVKAGQVQGSWTKGRAMVVGLRGKGGGLDDIPLPGWAWEVVSEWKRMAGLGDEDWLVCEVRGKKGNETVVKGKGKAGMSGEGIRLRFAEICKRAGMEGRIRPHDGRRTCGGLIVETGGSGGLRQAQMQLRHKSVRTTESYIGAGVELRLGLVSVYLMVISVPGKETREKLRKVLKKAGMKPVDRNVGEYGLQWGRKRSTGYDRRGKARSPVERYVRLVQRARRMNRVVKERREGKEGSE